MEDIKKLLTSQRERGVPVLSRVAASLMKGVISEKKPELLVENGGRLGCGSRFARRFMKRELGWTVRCAQGQ